MAKDKGSKSGGSSQGGRSSSKSKSSSSGAGRGGDPRSQGFSASAAAASRSGSSGGGWSPGGGGNPFDSGNRSSSSGGGARTSGAGAGRGSDPRNFGGGDGGDRNNYGNVSLTGTKGGGGAQQQITNAVADSGMVDGFAQAPQGAVPTTREAAAVQALAGTPAAQAGIAGILGQPAQQGPQTGQLAFSGQTTGKRMFAQEPMLLDINGNVVGPYTGAPEPGVIGQTDRVYTEDPDYFSLPPVGQTDRVYTEDPDYFAMPGALPPPQTPPAAYSANLTKPQVMVPDYGMPDYGMPAPVTAAPGAGDPLVTSYFGVGLGPSGMDALPAVDRTDPVRPGSYAPPELATQVAPMGIGQMGASPTATAPTADPQAALNQVGALFDQVLPAGPSRLASQDLPPPPPPIPAPVPVPTTIPPVTTPVPTTTPPAARPPDASLAPPAGNIPPYAVAPVGGGPLAGLINLVNPLGRLTGGPGFLPPSDPFTMDDFIAQQAEMDRGSDNSSRSLMDRLTAEDEPVADPAAVPSEKPAWWPPYLPWPPEPGTPAANMAPPTPAPVQPFTQYPTSYGSMQGAISGAQNPLMMGVGGMVRRR